MCERERESERERETQTGRQRRRTVVQNRFLLVLIKTAEINTRPL